MLLPSAAPSAAEAAAPLAVGVGVRFDGPLRGRLELRVSGDVARSVAENMLGVDASDVDEALVRDALGEVANVVCGNLLPELAGRDAVFRLDAPRAAALACAACTACGACAAPTTTLSLGVDGGRAELALHLD